MAARGRPGGMECELCDNPVSTVPRKAELICKICKKNVCKICRSKLNCGGTNLRHYCESLRPVAGDMDSRFDEITRRIKKRLDSLEKKEQLKDQEVAKLEYELQLAKQQKEKIARDKHELKSKLRNITEIWKEEPDEATMNMLVEQLCFARSDDEDGSSHHRHSGDRYNRSNYSSGAIPSDHHKYFETESEHELWEKWRLQFVEDSPHGYTVLRDQARKRFEFNHYGTDRQSNQERYEDVGKICEQIVYDRMVSYGQLQRQYLQDDVPGDGTFIFVSRNYETCDKLLVLIHGSGAVRAGQWSRRLLLQHSMEAGTQLPYVKQACEYRWGVLVMNTNDNYAYKGQGSPIKHGLYVWDKYVKRAAASKIAIVAHSAGGAVVMSMLSEFTDHFKKKVVAIALSDSYHDTSNASRDVRKHFEKVAVNWVTSTKPVGTDRPTKSCKCRSAGTTEHEETSYCAMDDIFKYIRQMFVR